MLKIEISALNLTENVIKINFADCRFIELYAEALGVDVRL